MKFFVQVPGSCGELLQGRIQGEPFLVTCPITLYTTVTVDDAAREITGLGRKSQQALQLLLQDLGRTAFPYGLQLTSDLPQGKGMASSSADIAAVMAAVQFALTGKIDAEKILALAVQIEPTDGTFLPGIVGMNPQTGKTRINFGILPAFRISVFDTGGTVDTQAFYRQQKLSTGKRILTEQKFEQVRKLFFQGIEQQNEKRLVEAMTQSACLNQQILYKKDLREFLQKARELGALGINIAHSGTVVGVFWQQRTKQPQIDAAVQLLQQQFVRYQYMQQVQLTSGGIFIHHLR